MTDFAAAGGMFLIDFGSFDSSANMGSRKECFAGLKRRSYRLVPKDSYWVCITTNNAHIQIFASYTTVGLAYSDSRQCSTVLALLSPAAPPFPPYDFAG